MSRIYYSHTSQLFTLPVLVLTVAEAVMLYTQKTHFTGSWALSWWMTATLLLGATVAWTILHQFIRLNSIDVSSFLPPLLLATSSTLLLFVLSRPRVVDSHHFTSVMTIRFEYLLYAGFVLSATAFALAFRSVIKDLPASLYPWKDGRLLAIDVDKVSKHAKPSPRPNKVSNTNSDSRFPAVSAQKTFKDVLGVENFKAELMQAFHDHIEFGKNGILLHGLPGGGKTLMAEALAGEIGRPIMKINSGDLASKWINQTTENLVAMFKAAVAQVPCVLFIDEIEATLRTRELETHGYEEHARLVSTFLNWAETIRRHQILLIGATNYIDWLDKAAIREGRFDFKIEVPLPDEKARTALIQSGLKATNCTIDPDLLKRMVRRWAGFNVARIMSATAAACKIHGEDQGPVVYADFFAGLRKVQGRKTAVPNKAMAFDDLFMEPTQRARLLEISRSLIHIDAIEAAGGISPRGILFYGPPGTGKTTMAMALAKESGWTFIERSGRDMFHTDALTRLKEDASDLRPAIIFIDEADDILANRSFSGHKSITNDLLALLDGASDTLVDTVWIAATNLISNIDPAALRGGRFEQQILFGPPSDAILEQMLTDWIDRGQRTVEGSRDAWLAQASEIVRGATLADLSAALRATQNRAVHHKVFSHQSKDTPLVILLKDLALSMQELHSQQ